MKDQDILEILKSKYQLSVTSIERIKGVYRVETEENIYCLKIVNYNYPHFLFILQAINYLRDRGFYDTPEIKYTVEGRQYVQCEDKFAYLTNWLKGRECSYDNPIELSMAARKLGELHSASEGFEISNNMEPRVGWLKWIEVYRTRKNEILDFKYKIKDKKIKNNFDLKYDSLIEEELERCDKSIDNLCSSNYEKKMLRDIKYGGFCHHDYANHNVIINSQGANIIDFDYCILDSYLHDLASLLLRAMKYDRWSEARFKTILNAYRSVHRLDEEDIGIMIAFMEFPQDFWQRGIQCYWENQPWGEEFFLRKIKLYEEDRLIKQLFLDKVRNYDFNNL